MEGANETVRAVTHAVNTALTDLVPAVLAISGGLDSMVLLDAAAASRPAHTLVVATFDHGTGPFSRRATALVARRAAALGLSCVTGHIDAPASTEAAWRRARWTFLREVAASRRGTVVTAHTKNDQIETVFMRILRDAGPRGLCGLYAPSSVARPLLSFSRSDLSRYAQARAIPFITDPSNTDRRHLRNRIRHDLLPAIVALHPTFPAELLAIAHASAHWRHTVDRLAGHLGATVAPSGTLRIARSALTQYDVASLRVLWPALAAQVDVVMDRRGTHRLAAFTIEGATGGSIQLSGGVEVLMRRDEMVLRRWRTE